MFSKHDSVTPLVDAADHGYVEEVKRLQPEAAAADKTTQSGCKVKTAPWKVKTALR